MTISRFRFFLAFFWDGVSFFQGEVGFLMGIQTLELNTPGLE